MKTKTLLIAAAALAAGVITSQAQVYSQNVVGYVNVPCPSGAYVLVSNPLDNGTNTANDLCGSLPNKSTISVWNGAGYTSYTKGSAGFSPNPSIPVGKGFFINSSANYTNTFVGSVLPVVGGSTTNNMPAGTSILVGSRIPVGGTFNDVGTNTLNLIAALPNKSTIQLWNGTGYTSYTKGSAGFSPNPTLQVGQGFFINSSSAANWVQTLGQ